jgi:hypothetical protein
MKPAIATYNPHKWFFGHVNSLEGYNKEFAKVIREGIVFEYSEGKTESLKVMYDNHRFMYDRMRRKLTGGFKDELDMARKRVIAVLFSWLSYKGYKADIAYVKKVACNAAGSQRFNAIPLLKLRQLYRIFGDMKSKEAEAWVTGVLNKVMEDMTNETTKS